MSARYTNHNRFDLLNNEFLIEAIQSERDDLNIKENNGKNRTNNVLSQNIDLDMYDFSKIDSLINKFKVKKYKFKPLHYFGTGNSHKKFLSILNQKIVDFHFDNLDHHKNY